MPGPATVVRQQFECARPGRLEGRSRRPCEKGDTRHRDYEINLDKHKADEPAQWAKIALPASIKVWVDSQFIDAATKTVVPQRN